MYGNGEEYLSEFEQSEFGGTTPPDSFPGRAQPGHEEETYGAEDVLADVSSSAVDAFSGLWGEK